MHSKVQKWGNSLALRIPQAVARQIHVAEGDTVTLHVDAETLSIRPARPRYRLADLLRRVTVKNTHSETEWGAARGKEVW